ncbi:MAG: chemotaxis protein CheD [Candidatus Krumholzibacteriota bacterium]|nr:chemotaxis protein CheD [Candidatus Krumholzibacteriota bacterium]
MVYRSEAGVVIKVGMAQYRVGEAPMKMMTLALGSCIGIVLYDQAVRIGALAHVMHPRRDRVKSNANKAKFVDTAIDLMLSRMIKRGADIRRIVAKIFGGSTMFGSAAGGKGVIQIGEENTRVARLELAAKNIPLVAESVGGSKGRTILFDLFDGSVLVRYAYGDEEIC